MGNKIEEMLEGILYHTVANSRFLAAMYQAEQQKKAEENPGDWRAYTTTVISLNPTMQILAKQIRRHTLTITNVGNNSVYLSNIEFHGDAIAESYSDNGSVNVLSLESGDELEMSTSGAVYAYAANGNAKLQIVETLYAAAIDNTSALGRQPKGKKPTPELAKLA
jgi:hypothetical protein